MTRCTLLLGFITNECVVKKTIGNEIYFMKPFAGGKANCKGPHVGQGSPPAERRGTSDKRLDGIASQRMRGLT